MLTRELEEKKKKNKYIFLIFTISENVSILKTSNLNSKFEIVFGCEFEHAEKD